MTILGMVATGEKPDTEAVEKLVDVQADLSRDGSLSKHAIGTLRHYLRRTLRSANISREEIRQLETLVEQSAQETGLNEKQRKALVSRMPAVARSVQAKQRDQ